MEPHVSQHAIERFQQRVANLDEAAVVARLSSPVICKAIEFGAGTVILGTGQRVVIKGRTIVTVKSASRLPAYAKMAGKYPVRHRNRDCW